MTQENRDVIRERITSEQEPFRLDFYREMPADTDGDYADEAWAEHIDTLVDDEISRERPSVMEDIDRLLGEVASLLDRLHIIIYDICGDYRIEESDAEVLSRSVLIPVEGATEVIARMRGRGIIDILELRPIQEELFDVESVLIARSPDCDALESAKECLERAISRICRVVLTLS